MSSEALQELKTRLRDVDELIGAHKALTGGKPGRPAKRQGAAITRAGVVLLCAATEAFVEELFEEAARLVFNGMPDEDIERLFKSTSKRFNNADVHKTEMLYFNLGLPWAVREISWKKFTNDTLREELDKLIAARNKIAHGRNNPVWLQTLRRWKNMVEMFAPRFEKKVGDHVMMMTGNRPAWPG